MSSTSNIQNLLANIIRPVYVYDAATSNYTTKVVISNVEAFWGNSIYVGNLTFGDANRNLYMGSNAGSSDVLSRNNVGVGYGAAQNVSNVQNSVFVGYTAGGPNITDASASVVVGANTQAGGASNVYIGYATGSVSNTAVGNIFVGPRLGMTSAVSNQVRIGSGCNVPFSADMNTGFVGINNTAPQYELDVSGMTSYFRGKVGVQRVPNGSLSVNGYTESSFFAAEDGTQVAPAYTFQSDTSLGWYKDTGAVRFASNGSNVVSILSSGYIDISGTVRADAFIGTSSGGGSGGVIFSNGTVQTLDGSVTAPSHTFQSDLSMGLYRVGSNAMSLAYGGSNRLILSNGFVGVGGISAPAYTLDVNGTTRTQNTIVTGYLRNALTPSTLDISSGNISNSGTTSSRNLRVIGPGVLDATQRSLVELSGGDNNSGSALRSIFGFQNNDAGGYRHFLRTRHNPGSNTGNAVEFFVNTGSSSGDSIAPGTSNVLGLSIMATGISNISGTSNTLGGVVLSNSNASGLVTVSTSNILANGYIRDTLTPGNLDISGGNISNSATTRSSNFVTPTASSNSIGGVVLNNSNASNIATLTTSNVIASGYLRNALTPSTFDISGGNISNSGVHTTLGLVGTYLRNALTPSTYDISGGNISNSATHTSSNFVTPTASSNSIGGVVLSNSNASGLVTVSTSNILANGYIRDTLTPGNLDISSGTVAMRYARVGGLSNLSSLTSGQPASVEIGGGDDSTASRSSAGIAFQYFSGGGLRHFIRTRHKDATNDPANAIDFFVNNSITLGGSTLPGTGNKLGLSVTGTGVGIGTLVPTYPLDVSCAGSSARVYGGALLVTSNNSVTAPSGMRMVAASGDSYIQYGSDVTSNGFGTANLRFGAINASTNAMVMSPDGYVGVRKNPSYPLDVDVSAAGTACVNMTTWTRTTTAVSYYGVYAGVSGAGNTIWTASNSIDSSIITVGSNVGTYFVVNKSGLYSINLYVNGTTAGTPLMTIDCSTNPAHDGFNAIWHPQLAYNVGASGIGQLSVNYTGFLPSNSGLYYKAKISAITPSVVGRNGARLNISFLGETPIVTGFPI